MVDNKNEEKNYEIEYVALEDDKTLNETSFEYSEEIYKEAATDKKISFLKEVYEWVSSIALAVFLALIINQFLFALVQVDGRSMEPTLYHGERLLVRKILYTPEQGDVVIVKSNAIQKNIVKRIIALPGQTIDFDEDMNVTIDGKVIDEPYIKEKQISYGNMYSFPLTIPEDCYFVMGDNRNNSSDSRTLGLIPEDEIVGESSIRLFPFSRFGMIDQ